MKQLLKLTTVLICLLIGGCSEKKEKVTFTTIDYASDWATNQYIRSTARKVTKGDDVKYFVPYTDTLRDEKQLPLYDSARKVKIGMQWRELVNQFVIHDFNKDWEKITEDYRKSVKDRLVSGAIDTTKK